MVWGYLHQPEHTRVVLSQPTLTFPPLVTQSTRAASPPPLPSAQSSPRLIPPRWDRSTAVGICAASPSLFPSSRSSPGPLWSPPRCRRLASPPGQPQLPPATWVGLPRCHPAGLTTWVKVGSSGPLLLLCHCHCLPLPLGQLHLHASGPPSMRARASWLST